MKNTYRVGAEVLVRTNEPEPLWKGTITRLFEAHSTPIPYVMNQDGVEYMCPCKVVEYSPELEEELLKMEWWEQYNRLANEGSLYHITPEHAAKREKEVGYERHEYRSSVVRSCR